MEQWVTIPEAIHMLGISEKALNSLYLHNLKSTDVLLYFASCSDDLRSFTNVFLCDR